MDAQDAQQRNERARLAVWGGRDKAILVPLDGSPEAKLALPVARLISRVTLSPVHVLHVAERPLAQLQLIGQLNLEPEEMAGLVIDQATGDPADVIVERSRSASTLLIVMTTRGASGYGGRLLRPITERVACEASSPVMLVRPEQRERLATLDTLNHVLLPLDGTPSTEVAVHPGVSLAEEACAELDILFVAETKARAAQEAGTMTGPRYVDQPQYEWPAWTEEFLDRFCAAAGECPPRARMAVRTGNVAEEIVAFAAEHPSDLIVLEWHGCLASDRASVVRGVLANSPCPVMLLKAPE